MTDDERAKLNREFMDVWRALHEQRARREELEGRVTRFENLDQVWMEVLEGTQRHEGLIVELRERVAKLEAVLKKSEGMIEDVVQLPYRHEDLRGLLTKRPDEAYTAKKAAEASEETCRESGLGQGDG